MVVDENVIVAGRIKSLLFSDSSQSIAYKYPPQIHSHQTPSSLRLLLDPFHPGSIMGISPLSTHKVQSPLLAVPFPMGLLISEINFPLLGE